MALCTHQVGVLYGVTIHSVLTIKLRISTRDSFAAFRAFPVLLPPFQALEFSTEALFASFIVSKFFDYLSAISEQQLGIASR